MKLIYLIFILVILIRINTFANEDKKFSEAHYVKCYSLFVRERPSINDPVLTEIKMKKISSQQACMRLLYSAQFNKNSIIDNPTENIIGQKILRTFNQFHNSWFPNYLTYMTTDGPETFDIVELEEPALFVTQALFNSKWKYKDIVLGEKSFHGIRLAKEKSQYLIGSLSAPKIKIENNYFLSGLKDYVHWKPNTVEHGVLVGIKEMKKNKEYLPESVNDLFFPKVSKEPIDIRASAGGGFMGSNSYLLFNIGRTLGEKSNGTNSMPRKLSQQILRDILCRELPVIEPQDTLKYLTGKSSVPWANNKNCMACHVTMDNMVSTLRNTEIVLSKDGGRGSYHVKLHRPEKNRAQTDLYYKSVDYFKTEPQGRFVYRDIHNKLIDIPINKFNDIGIKISNLDDFYRCATTKYLYFLTGIKSILKNEIDKSELDSKILIWTNNLKKTQRLDQLISDIIDSKYFRDRMPDITN